MLCDKVQKGHLCARAPVFCNVTRWPTWPSFSCCSADDIEIIFRQGSWKANGEFAQTDVHRQIAIVFKTPPYQDQDIAEEVEVSISLRRISDQMESDPISFTYLPHNPGEGGGGAHWTVPLLRKTNMSVSVLTLDPYEVKRKRKIKSDVGFREKPCATGKMWLPFKNNRGGKSTLGRIVV